MICLDLDGTTITHEGVLRPAVREAVQAVLAAGHHVVVVKGQVRLFRRRRCSS